MRDIVRSLIPKIYSYRRLSTDEQLKGGGDRRQRDDFDIWLESKRKAGNTMPVDDELRLIDHGVSAFKGDNAKTGKLALFLQEVEQGRIAKGSILSLESLDRLSREEVYDSAYLLLGLLRKGVDIVTFGRDGAWEFKHDADPNSQLVNLVIAITILARGNNESGTKSFRVAEEWEDKRKRASETLEPMTKICPGWLRLDEETDKYELILERQKLVREIFDRAAAGQGKRRIAKAFNDRSEPTWGRGDSQGAVWHDSYIQRILNNEQVIGIHHPGTKRKNEKYRPIGEKIEGYFPAAIDEDLWWKVRHGRNTRKRGGGKPSDAFRSAFRGLCYCGFCGMGMTYIDKGAGKKNGRPKLVCTGILVHSTVAKKHPDKTKCTNELRYSHDGLQRLVLFGIGKDAKNLLGRTNERHAAIEKQVAVARGKIADLYARRDRLVGALEAGATEVTERLTALRGEIAASEAAIEAKTAEARATEPLKPVSGKLSDLMEALKKYSTNEERRELNIRLKRLIERIDFAPAKKGGATVVVSFVAGDKAKWFLPAT